MENFLKNPLIKFSLWLLFGLIICFWGMTHTLAWETKTIYSDSGRTNSNKYLYGTNANGGIGTASTGTNISGVSYGFSFWLNENVMLNKTYTLKINFMGDDLYNTFSSNMVNVSTCYSSTCNDNIILSIEKQSNSGRSTWLKITFNPVSTGSYLYLGLSSDTVPLEAIAGPVAFGINSVQIESVNESQNIIDNQTANSNNIINNQNNNTQDIINNQNQNTQDIMESQEVCSTLIIDKSLIIANGVLLDNGTTTSVTDGRGYTDYIAINNVKKLKNLLANTDGGNNYLCFYDDNKSVISCINSFSYNNNQNISVPSNTKYIRFTINGTQNRPQFELSYCQNGNQAMQDTITNDNVDSSPWANFFNNFTTNTFGLTSIVTAPLNLIQSITNTTCSDLQLPLPYLNNKYLTLPCMSSIYSQYFGTFFTLYQTITYGIIAYWVCVRIFNLVKDFKNPDHDEIEVVDL